MVNWIPWAMLLCGKRQQDELLSDWTAERLEELENEDLSLRMRGQLMEIPTRGEDEGQLVVNYDEKLVILLREVQQLHEMALSVLVKSLRPPPRRKVLPLRCHVEKGRNVLELPGSTDNTIPTTDAPKRSKGL